MQTAMFKISNLLPFEIAIKNIKDTKVGDTITLTQNPTKTPLLGYKKAEDNQATTFDSQRH